MPCPVKKHMDHYVRCLTDTHQIHVDLLSTKKYTDDLLRIININDLKRS